MKIKTNNQNKTWEERFDEQAMTDWDISELDQKKLKTFISKEIEEERERGRKIYKDLMANPNTTYVDFKGDMADYSKEEGIRIEVWREAVKEFYNKIKGETT